MFETAEWLSLTAAHPDVFRRRFTNCKVRAGRKACGPADGVSERRQA